jgi:hypothetical protein
MMKITKKKTKFNEKIHFMDFLFFNIKKIKVKHWVVTMKINVWNWVISLFVFC